MRETVRNQANAMKEINDIAMKGEIVVFGSTYMSRFPLYELTNKCMLENAVYNRSINGLTLKEATALLKDCVIDLAPSKIFLSLGEEDENDPTAIDSYSQIVSALRTNLPESDIYLIGLTETSAYAESFNKKITELCDNKKIKYIKFVSKQASDTTLYKARFKQLSSFFRNNPITMPEAFSITSL